MEETTNNGKVNFGDWFITDAPRTLDDIYGQPAIVKFLKECQKTGVYPKSTFFQGQFGSGKTALAKIMAKDIACRNKDTNGCACGTCPTCTAIDEERYGRDVIYMNAEEMGAQDIRDQLEQILKFPAVKDAAKVIICDETQALSKEAVEAFLSATQSPRKGYFFIFTAMDKLKGAKAGALQSRCKVWKMKTPTFQDIYMYLAKVSQNKGLTKETTIPREFWTEGLQFIAENSEYSFRKAIQYLEQAYTGRLFTKAEMKEAFNIVSQDDAVKALIDFASGNPSQIAWEAINGMDYQDKFPLMLAIIGDAQTVKAFGTKFIENEELWKWKDKIALANAPQFEKLRDGFMELASKAYVSRGEWKIICSKLLEGKTTAVEHLKEEAPKRAGRSRV